MDNLLGIETRYREHAERVVSVDRDGWKCPQSGPRSHRLAGMRLALTGRLTALAMRLAPPTRGTRTA